MENPIDSFVGEIKGTVILVITAIIVIMVLGTIGVAFGMQELTNQLISSITVGVILILAIPSMALIGLIIWIIKKAQDSSNYL